MISLKKRIDCHVHYALPLEADTLVSFMDETDTHMANLVLVPHTRRLSTLPDESRRKKYRPRHGQNLHDAQGASRHLE